MPQRYAKHQHNHLGPWSLGLVKADTSEAQGLWVISCKESTFPLHFSGSAHANHESSYRTLLGTVGQSGLWPERFPTSTTAEQATRSPQATEAMHLFLLELYPKLDAILGSNALVC